MHVLLIIGRSVGRSMFNKERRGKSQADGISSHLIIYTWVGSGLV